MAEAPAEQPGSKRWPSRPVRAIFYAILALAAADLIASLVTGLMLGREIRKLRASGDMPPPGQLIPQVPSGLANAADVYLLAFSARQLPEGSEETLFGGPVEEWSPLELADARRIMAANAEHFRILDQASRIPGCAFPVNWQDGVSALFPHLAEIRQSTRLLLIRAVMEAQDGLTDAALADCGTMLRIAGHTECESTIIAQTVAQVVQDAAVQALRKALPSGDPSPKAARELMNQLAAADNTKPFEQAVKGELVLFGVKLFDLARSRNGKDAEGLMGEDPEHPWRGRALGAYATIARPLANLDEIAYLHAMKRSIDAVALPWPRSKKQLEAADQWVEDLPGYRSLLTRMSFPQFTRAVENRDSRTAALRAALVAVALIIYKSERGAYPDSLVALRHAGFKLPTDPFTQQPYRYHRNGDGFVVYSLGPDMHDQGGRPFSPNAGRHLPREEAKKRVQEYDIPFRRPR